MTAEEFLTLKMLIKQNQRHILQNQQHLQQLIKHADRDRWYVSFGSDVAANVFTTSAFWLLGKLFKK